MTWRYAVDIEAGLRKPWLLKRALDLVIDPTRIYWQTIGEGQSRLVLCITNISVPAVNAARGDGRCHY